MEEKKKEELVQMLSNVTDSLELVLDWYCDLADVYVETDDDVRGINEVIQQARGLLESVK